MDATVTKVEAKPARKGSDENALDVLLDSHVAEMPAADANIDEQITELKDAEENALREQETFDASIHETDSSGAPVQNVDGSYRRKRGRKAGVNYDGKSGSIAATDKGAKAAAVATVETILVLGRTLGGDEWTPIRDKNAGIDERGNMVDAFTRYYEETGTTEMPAWVGVAIASLAYALPRTTLPTTKGRLAKAGAWVRGFFPGGKRKEIANAA